MKLKVRDLKAFLLRIPEEMDDYDVVSGEADYLDPNDENSMVYRIGEPIITLYVDQTEKEFCILSITREDISDFYKPEEDGNNPPETT